MLESHILTALALCFICYLVQDAILFAKWRNQIKIFTAKKLVTGGGPIWQFANHNLHCAFCLSFWINLCIVGMTLDWLSAATVPVIVSFFYRWTFK